VYTTIATKRDLSLRHQFCERRAQLVRELRRKPPLVTKARREAIE